ncbi:toluene tolerance protein [Aquipseudomonas alcaligenes]|uniref:Toluene tolerance protein n=1 Tax=Aquipseudomonas alcaligenes TaxID=43263 RepID=A0A2V4LXK9_AQUAC|nr:serine/threonine-protein kinase [Pseudomonas alcaligenes]PYC29540.1 toluene tolerance protein [Pseudomonas alcaligenes]
MRIVSANELQNWLDTGHVLERDSHGPKVVRLTDGSFLKIFRSRRNPLLARLRPDARRFAKCAERLQRLGIHTPHIDELYWIDRDKVVSACLYQPLEGQPLDKLFRDSRDEFYRLLPHLAAYIHLLHQRGIYFRSLHLGNILRTPDDDFGLIDFLDTRFKRHPLSNTLVKRNFHHLKRYLDRRKVQNFPWDELLKHYARVSAPRDKAP